MSAVLGLNAVFHDPAAALVLDGEVVAAAEEERFSRRKHGKQPVPFSTWELPVDAMTWCLEWAGVDACELDAIAYSYDPSLVGGDASGDGVGVGVGVGTDVDLTADGWEGLRTLFASRAARFLATALPGSESVPLRFVPHHVAHAASAYLGGPHRDTAVLVADGRGERHSVMAGSVDDGVLRTLFTQELPHSLGLLYEELTVHCGFHRSSDEYKVMALASYGSPIHLEELRRLVRFDPQAGVLTEGVDLSRWVPRADGSPSAAHADLAASVQRRLEEVLLDLARWLHAATGKRSLVMAGGVALNCVANEVLWRHGPFDDIWVQPAAGDAGTALGAAMYVAEALGDRTRPMATASLGRGWSDDEIREVLVEARVPFERPDDVAEEVAQRLADDQVVAWFQGRSEFGPRALGHRSLLADPRWEANLERLNDIKGREQFRPVAPMVTLERADEVFDGPVPSPHMLFVHRVNDQWKDRIPAVVHVDGTARAQTVDRRDEPLMAAVLDGFEARTGVPVVVNTSFNTAGRPMVDSPRDALECFATSPIDALALGPYVVSRPA
jgi:carbamoyltransferase